MVRDRLEGVLKKDENGSLAVFFPNSQTGELEPTFNFDQDFVDLMFKTNTTLYSLASEEGSENVLYGYVRGTLRDGEHIHGIRLSESSARKYCGDIMCFLDAEQVKAAFEQGYSISARS